MIPDCLSLINENKQVLETRRTTEFKLKIDVHPDRNQIAGMREKHKLNYFTCFFQRI